VASVDLIGHGDEEWSPQEGAAVLARRSPDPRLAPESAIPDDTRLWAAMQSTSGGLWGGCVYDVDELVRTLEAGRRALAAGDPSAS
jgi:hypothetical protein